MLRLTSVAVTKLIFLFYMMSLGYWIPVVLLGMSLAFNLLMMLKSEQVEEIKEPQRFLILFFPVTIMVGFILLGGISKE